MIVIAYLVAIVAANLIVSVYGPAASVGTAFALIGLNITARDRLHEQWRHRRLKLKMGSLIAAGSVISYALNKDAASIAVASAVAFGSSEGVDAFVYGLMKERGWITRSNTSNIFSAAVDSVVFPTIAFGVIMPSIILAQFAAKVFGGLLWSLILRPKKVAVAMLACLALSAPASSQIANVSVGRLVVDGFTDDVAEVFAATPAIGGLRISAIASVPLSDITSEPTLIAQLSADPWRYLGFDVGVVDTPFARPTATVGMHSFHAVGPTVLTVIHSYQPADKTQTTIVKIGITKFWR